MTSAPLILLAVGAFGTVSALLYLAFGMNGWIALAAAGIAFGVVQMTGARVVPRLPPEKPLTRSRFVAALAIGAAAADAWLLLMFVLVRTAEPIQSPWEFFAAEPFLLYGAATFALFLALPRLSSRAAAFSLGIHYCASYSVAAIVYRLGFGFDPFVHRAAEQALLTDGVIEPRGLLYAGQYAAVTALSHLTGLSIDLIDRWLVPALAFFSFPLVIPYGLYRGWGLDRPTARRMALLLLVIPYLFFVFTVPHNLVAVLFVWIIFLLPAASRDRELYLPLALVAAFAVLTHPLLGLPAALLVLFFAVWNQFRSIRAHAALGAIGIAVFALSVPVAFALWNALHGAPGFGSANPLAHLDRFFSLFTDPFRPDPPASFFWNALYAYPIATPPKIFIGALVTGLLMYRRSPHLSPYALFGLGTVGALFFIATIFTFKDIIASEQFEFALRLKEAMYLVSVPFLAVTVGRFLRTRIGRREIVRALVGLAVAVAATISWYVSYPQMNPKNQISGQGVGDQDIVAVRFIKAASRDTPHLVLSNQMTAAAALREFGFARYLATADGPALWYPLPTGSALYTYFLDMTQNGPRREVMEKAADFAGVRRAYFLTYQYWDGFEILNHKARAIADRWYQLHGGAIMVYEFQF